MENIIIFAIFAGASFFVIKHFYNMFAGNKNTGCGAACSKCSMDTFAELKPEIIFNPKKEN